MTTTPTDRRDRHGRHRPAGGAADPAPTHGQAHQPAVLGACWCLLSLVFLLPLLYMLLTVDQVHRGGPVGAADLFPGGADPAGVPDPVLRRRGLAGAAVAGQLPDRRHPARGCWSWSSARWPATPWRGWSSRSRRLCSASSSPPCSCPAFIFMMPNFEILNRLRLAGHPGRHHRARARPARSGCSSCASSSAPSRWRWRRAPGSTGPGPGRPSPPSCCPTRGRALVTLARAVVPGQLERLHLPASTCCSHPSGSPCRSG